MFPVLLRSIECIVISRIAISRFAKVLLTSRSLLRASHPHAHRLFESLEPYANVPCSQDIYDRIDGPISFGVRLKLYTSTTVQCDIVALYTCGARNTERKK